jgi:1-acyl-sn-glycerol-3-phosphate acyltransferase
MRSSPEIEAGAGLWRAVARVVFWASVGILTAAYCLLLPALLLPRTWVLAIVRSYLASILWLLRALFGLRWSIAGDWRKAQGPVLVAAKHQSAFETLILQYQLGDPAIILKRELLAIPIFGWALRRLGHIGVDRSGDLEGARQLLAAAKKAHQEGRPVLIFPEGSRRQVNAPPDYKSGVELLYAVLKAPCVPVAVNSGRVWPTRSLTPGSGQIVIEFLPPIEAGLPRVAFGERLEREVEEATARLLRGPA